MDDPLSLGEIREQEVSKRDLNASDIAALDDLYRGVRFDDDDISAIGCQNLPSAGWQPFGSLAVFLLGWRRRDRGSRFKEAIPTSP